MLLSLTIKDLVLIDSLTLTFEDALSVLTGETGAGKSILLDALGLALGMRGEISLIRQGVDQAVVTAEFCIQGNEKIASLLQDHGLEEASILVFRRILNRAGRSRAFINDQMVGNGLLRLLGDSLLEIHGQFDRLLDPTAYRLLLDEFAKNHTLKTQVSQAYDIWQSSVRQLQEATQNLERLRQNEELIKVHVKELQKLNPLPGEEENLLADRVCLAHIGKLADVIRDVHQHMQVPSLETALHASIKILQRAEDHPKINAALQALERGVVEVIEANAQLLEVSDDLADQPRRLLEIDERLHALRVASRKHGVMVDELAQWQETLLDQLQSLDDAAGVLAQHETRATADRAAYVKAAQDLRDSRCTAAQILEQSVMTELPALKLPHAQFVVQLTELTEPNWGESGMDRIDFMVAMNKGQDLCSLSKSASGGELARLMLALKVALASRSAIPTIIFDEIDTGVGGAVASAIGDRLASLAQHLQVLAITHSPQLAACAQHHFLVSKADQGLFMRTHVQALSSEERKDEVARMLSGAEITEEARAAAQSLLRA